MMDKNYNTFSFYSSRLFKGFYKNQRFQKVDKIFPDTPKMRENNYFEFFVLQQGFGYVFR